MKLFYFVLVFWCFAAVLGQRRASRPESTETESTPRTIRRGRTRFVVPEETAAAQPAEEQKPTTGRRAPARRRPSEVTAPVDSVGRRNYEVEELVDENPPAEISRRPGKTRVLTETRFEAANAPPVNSLFQPSTTESLEEIIQSIGSDLLDAATTPAPIAAPQEEPAETSPPVISTSSEIPKLPKIENEIRRESTRRQPETSSTTASASRRRVGLRRTNSNAAVRTEESTTAAAASRTRSRTRPPKKTEEVSSTPAPSSARGNFRTVRRRPVETTETRTRGPSVLTSSETVELPTRSRPGRRTPAPAKNDSPEKISLDIQPTKSNLRRNLGNRQAATEPPAVTKPTQRNRSRSRFRDVPPVIDEQKLEVLPLFESEAKTVRPSKKNLLSRSRSLNLAESVEMSATENDIQIAQKPEIKVTTPSNDVVSRKQSVVVETRTESSYKRRKPIVNKPVIKETVISEITEVTSKRTVNRKPSTRGNLPITANKYKRIKSDEPKVTVSEVVNRGRKKSETILTGVKTKSTSSEEEIDESDNYPEAFKALIHAKKQGKESRSKQRLDTLKSVTKTTERIVTSSTVSTTTTTTTIATTASTTVVPQRQQVEDFENEVDPKPSSTARPTRRRLTQPPSKSTERPIRQTTPRRTLRPSTSTASSVVPVREHRFHAKFNTPASDQNSTEKATKAFSPKPRGLYSSRKNKDIVVKNVKQVSTAGSTVPKKANRYSSRYRNEGSSRGTIRTSTNAPAYLPTIPTIRPSTTVNSPLEDKDLGLEIISFDDPVNTVPSANLINEDYLTSSTEKSPLVAEAQTKDTEKPVNIIERIINSITAISTEAPALAKITTPVQETVSKESAILKLATKKPTKLDKTVTPDKTTQKIFMTPSPVTTEKPTTIIERILSSLSAIQAENVTDTKSFNSKQVGTTNFNTISFPSTTPLSRVPKSTLSALSSTSINPLSVLDEISNEQTLQKRTIGKLLALLNSLTSTTENPKSQQLVVVTPKKTFVSSTLETTTETVTTTTTPSTTTPAVLYTSPTRNLIDTNTAKNTNGTTQAETTTTAAATTQPSTTPIDGSLTTIAQSSRTTQDLNNDLGGVLPLFVDSSVTSLLTEPTTPSTVSTTDSFFSFGTTSTEPTTFNTETVFTFPSTLPDLVNFEVSPGSVSIFSANDLLSNAITPDDISSTVAITTSRNNDDIASTVTAATTRTNAPDVVTTVSSTTTQSDSTTTATPVTVSSRLNLLDATTTVDSITTTTTTDSSITSAPLTTTASAVTVSPVNSTDPIVANSNATNSGNSSSLSPTNLSNRSGRLLNIIQDVVQSNSIENSTAGSDKDYFIFAVLNNNTILRKRPSRFPNKETPFLIVGAYPNGTIVRKFPNGTLVPMEPIIRVSGFDTRENPPPLPEITSNQVTPDQGSRPDIKNLQTVEQNTIPSVDANALSVNNNRQSETTTETSTEPQSTTTIQANPLSVSSPVSSSTITTTTNSPEMSTNTISSSTVETTTIPVSTITKSTTVTLPRLTEILNGRTVQAFNKIINISDLTKNQEPASEKSNTILPSTTPTAPQLSNRILENPTTNPPSTTTGLPTTTIPPTTTTILTTQPPTTSTTPPTTTSLPQTTKPPPTTTQRLFTTIFPTLQPAFRSTTYPSTTLFPVFLQNLLSTLQPPTTTLPPSTMRPRVNLDLVSASTTTRSISTTTPPVTTTKRSRGTRPVTTTIQPVATSTRRIRTTASTPLTSDIPADLAKVVQGKTLTEQQRKDLEAIAQLEREQQNLLKQLSLLTNLNLGNNNNNSNKKPTTEKSDLASRVIALAVERDKTRQTTTSTTEEPRKPKKIDPNQPIEEIVKQLNIEKPSAVNSPYGKSNDAIIAALLKDQGIGPTTPKALEDIYTLTTTTRRPRPTTRAPGPLMQSLNWLLNALAPPTTKRPRPKPKPKPKKQPEEELLTHQPTHITPVVTAAPKTRQNLANSLSQDDIKKLINQLEAIQKSPGDSKGLDLSSIKSLQSLINSDQVTSRSRVRASSERSGRSRVVKSTTSVPISVSNSIDNDDEDLASTTLRARPSLPPVKLKPVPGIEEGETMVRGQLVTAAVNVTRAISSFLSTALQGAASSFQTIIGSGSRAVGNLMRGSLQSGEEHK